MLLALPKGEKFPMGINFPIGFSCKIKLPVSIYKHTTLIVHLGARKVELSCHFQFKNAFLRLLDTISKMFQK
jgi:hypothetical protein